MKYVSFLLNIEQKYVYESHFQFQDLPHVRRANNFTAHLQAYEIPDFICFKAPVTGSDFYKWSHHYKLGPFLCPLQDGGSPKKFGDENREKFECDICGRQVGRLEHLKRHKKIHEPGPTWR